MNVKLLLMIPIFFFASTVISQENECLEQKRFAFKVKNGFFYPQESVLKNIFARSGSKGGYWFEGAACWRLWNNLNLEASGSYFERSGRALCGSECTKVKIPTFGLGVKYFFNGNKFSNCYRSFLGRISPFIGGGLRVFFYRECNQSQFMKTIEKTTVGGMLNAGIEIDLFRDLFVDLFVNYVGAKVKPTCNKVDSIECCPSCIYDLNIGGVIFGAAIGYKF